jgi:nitrate reductase molybdenum cofactor assembly chaperone
MNREAYAALAQCLTYPERQPIIGDGPWDSDLAELPVFTEAMSRLSLRDAQELFIQTFDLNPVCSLEMGWHLFGENYDRGLLLVKMRQQLRAYGIRETTELPDHLTNALRLIPCMDRESAGYFVEAIVLPAVQKMAAALAGKQNPYEHVLGAAKNLLRAQFPEIQLAAAAEGGELRVLA